MRGLKVGALATHSGKRPVNCAGVNHWQGFRGLSCSKPRPASTKPTFSTSPLQEGVSAAGSRGQSQAGAVAQQHCSVSNPCALPALLSATSTFSNTLPDSGQSYLCLRNKVSARCCPGMIKSCPGMITCPQTCDATRCECRHSPLMPMRFPSPQGSPAQPHQAGFASVWGKSFSLSCSQFQLKGRQQHELVTTAPFPASLWSL